MRTGGISFASLVIDRSGRWSGSRLSAAVLGLALAGGLARSVVSWRAAGQEIILTTRGHEDYMEVLIEMAGRKLEIELPDELFAQLEEVARGLQIADPAEAAVIGLAEWVSRRKSELDDRDPDQKYFVNEALDELMHKERK